MSFKKITTSAVVAMSLLAANLSLLATAANAGDGWRKHNDRGYSRHYDGPRHRYAYKRDRGHSGKNVAKRHRHRPRHPRRWFNPRFEAHR